MPGMGGLELLREITSRKIPGTAIMMSAFGTVETAVEAMKLGADDYISKPFMSDESLPTPLQATALRAHHTRPPPRDAPGERALRAQEGSVHRGEIGPGGADRGGSGRGALPGRGRGAGASRPGGAGAGRPGG